MDDKEKGVGKFRETFIRVYDPDGLSGEGPEYMIQFIEKAAYDEAQAEIQRLKAEVKQLLEQLKTDC
jgi:hypothetical protein